MKAPDGNWDEVGLAIEQLLPQLKSENPAAARAVEVKADVLENRLSSFLAETEGLPEKILQQREAAERLRQESTSFLADTEGSPVKISEQREIAKGLLLKIATVRGKLELHGKERGN